MDLNSVLHSARLSTYDTPGGINLKMFRFQYGWVRVEQGKFAQSAAASYLAGLQGKFRLEDCSAWEGSLGAFWRIPPGIQRLILAIGGFAGRFHHDDQCYPSEY